MAAFKLGIIGAGEEFADIARQTLGRATGNATT
jgi:hypothetical protein